MPKDMTSTHSAFAALFTGAETVFSAFRIHCSSLPHAYLVIVQDSPIDQTRWASSRQILLVNQNFLRPQLARAFPEEEEGGLSLTCKLPTDIGGGSS